MADSSVKVDRISSLPDDLLCQILSFLPIKEATATSILSPRWRYLIASIQDINLEFSDPSDDLDPIQQDQSDRKFSDFINFGHSLILRRNRAPIRKFELTIFPPSLSERFQFQINSLISAVLLCNVKDLEIFLCENETNRSDLLGIFTCKTLVVLKKDRRVDLDVPNSVDLPNLKVLHLECYSAAGKDSLRILIQGCPSLEELHLNIIECTKNLSDQLSDSGIFRCQKLVCLKLSWQDILHSINLVLPNSVRLPNLKILNLQDFKLVSKDSLRRLLHGCPLLQELYLFGLDCSNHASDILDLSSPSLKKLLLYCSLRDSYTVILELTSLQWLIYQANGQHIVFVNAPNLKVLDYASDAMAVNFTGIPKSAIRARIEVHSSFRTRIQTRPLHVVAAFQLVNHLRSVKTFCLSECTLEALYHSLDRLPTFMNLINLHLDFNEHAHEFGAYRIYWWKLLARLLESSPKLEVLVLDKVYWSNSIRDKEFENFLPAAFPASVVERLREIEIKAFIMLQNNCTLVEYFLQKGKALKKMTIGALLFPSGCNRLSFKKCSEDCQIVFQQVHYWHEPESD